MGSESFFCFIGGLFPIMAISVTRKMGLFKSAIEEFHYPPLQLIFSLPQMSTVGLIIGCIFFLCNYQVSFGLKGIFTDSTLKPNKTFKRILNFLCYASSFCLVAFSLLDFKHYSLINNLLFSSFLIFLLLFYYSVDLTGIACKNKMVKYHIVFDSLLTLMILIYLAYLNNALLSNDTKLLNTSSVLGYLTTGLCFFRYFLVGFQL